LIGESEKMKNCDNRNNEQKKIYKQGAV